MPPALEPQAQQADWTPTRQPAAYVEDLNFERNYASMKAHMTTVAGNEALVLDAARRYPNRAVLGLNPGAISTNIRADMLGEGTLKHRVVETVFGEFTPDADMYAARIAPLLVTPDIEGRTGLMFDRRGQAILPSKTVTPTHLHQIIEGSEQLLARKVPDVRH